VDSRDCVDGMVTMLNVASWIDSPLGPRVFFSKESFRAGAGTGQPPSHWVSGLKRLEREADCAPLSNPGLRMSGAISPVPYTHFKEANQS
jgi:hypothetical protein